MIFSTQLIPFYVRPKCTAEFRQYKFKTKLHFAICETLCILIHQQIKKYIFFIAAGGDRLKISAERNTSDMKFNNKRKSRYYFL